MVDDDLCGEGTADRPVGICGLDGVLDALDVRCAAVVEGGAEADDQDLVVADVVLIAGVVLGGIAGVAAKVIGSASSPSTSSFWASVRASHAALAASHWASVFSLRSCT